MEIRHQIALGLEGQAEWFLGNALDLPPSGRCPPPPFRRLLALLALIGIIDMKMLSGEGHYLLRREVPFSHIFVPLHVGGG